MLITIVGAEANQIHRHQSIVQAVNLASEALDIKIDINIIDNQTTEYYCFRDTISQSSGILVPGVFNDKEIKNKFYAVQYARENNIPFLGVCIGLQIAVIEFMHNVIGVTCANSVEFDPLTATPIITRIPHLWKNKQLEISTSGDKKLIINDNTLTQKIYDTTVISEYFYHNYQVNHDYIKILTDHGLVISATSCDATKTISIIELPSHTFFLGCQFHPECNIQQTGHRLIKSFLLGAHSNFVGSSNPLKII